MPPNLWFGLFLFNSILLKIVVNYYSKQIFPIHDFTSVTLAFDDQQQLTAHKHLPSSDNLGITRFTNINHVKLYKTAKTHRHILISWWTCRDLITLEASPLKYGLWKAHLLSQWTCRDLKNPGSFSFECKLWKVHLHVEN